ncbi:MAG TPA: 16S rRNA (adenine(1518)-N(6)/adenine(1519)-N(6))-dimethyltransferase RsmA [Candidatus Paceibacterota bacterium]|nr:16S rRNA (adenine(1518)-N(6)/adenine(1519)-N(6))-dimethyltransferase RsmA [Candidatus Paceibacterota bacterium]
MAKTSSLRKSGGVRAKKSLGQNFLMHARTAERIADVAHLSPDSVVLEIGPGTGQLTRALLARAGKVIAVEADVSLVEELQQMFAAEITEGTLHLTHADIRTFDPNTLPRGYVLVANIPYYITGELMRTFLSAENQPVSITFLVQKEVAERIARSKKESLLSLSVKAYGTPRYEFTVPRGAFVPAPNVDSAALSIVGISRDAFSTKSEETNFFKLIRAGFAHKRKQLLGNLKEIAPESAVVAALTSARISEKARAEDLALSDWLSLARTLH